MSGAAGGSKGKGKKATGVRKRCGKEGEVMQCSKCHKANYCGPECQKEDWKEHKKMCKELASKFAKERLASAQDKDYEGRFEGARRQFEKAAQVMQDNQGSGPMGSPHNMAIANYNVGQALCSEGRYDAAVEKLAEALGQFRTLYGDMHEATANALTVLGQALRWQGSYEQAAQRHKEALQIQLRVLGPDSVDVAMSLSSIGLLYQRTGMLPQALVSYRQALRVFRLRRGDEHEDVASALMNMAVILTKQGSFEEALENHKESLRIRR